MGDRELKAFNTLAAAGLVPVPQETMSGLMFYCHTLDNTEPGSAAIVSFNRETGRWGVLAPHPLQSRLLDALNV